MSHLPSERLAAFVDESPSAIELAHLASCAECARERALYQKLAELAASESARIGTPLTTWDGLAPVLRADGVIDNGRGFRPRVHHASRRWLQAAAVVLLVAGGMMAGRYTAGASVLPMNESPATVAAAPADSMMHFASVNDARAAQERSQAVYQTATAFLAQQDTAAKPVETPSAIRARLAAIERTNNVMGEALKTAPYDAVINDYYLSTLGQREATLRQLNAVMPASMRIMSY
ncbi:MAG TPA: hypothetical protein VGM67_06410 [Gemmatimonadaceae bacterium]|jgi:hypothetical protein